MEIPGPLSSILSLGTATSKNKGQPSQQLQLPLGQLLKATVVESIRNQLYSLDINGGRFTAESKTPLSIGQTLQLQVLKTEPQIELKIVNNSVNQFVGKSLSLVANNIDISPLMQALAQSPGTSTSLESLSLATSSLLENFFSLQQSGIDNTTGGNTIKQLLENIGFQFERNLASGYRNSAANTLKAALLEVIQVFKDSETIAGTAQKILTTIELFQLTHLQTSNSEFLFFPLPFAFLEAGYLQIEKDGSNKEGREQDEYRFSLHVKMAELGNINIDFIKSKESVLIRILAESEEKMQFIKQFEGELMDAISVSAHVRVSFGSDAADPVQNLIQHLVSEGTSMLDTKV